MNFNKDKIRKIGKKFDLELIMLFGSRANGRFRKDSDYDIAIISKKKISLKNELKIISALAEVFGEKIDLSIANHANPLLLFNISKNAIFLFGSKQDFFKFKLRAFHAYNDYQPYFKREFDFVKKQVAKL